MITYGPFIQQQYTCFIIESDFTGKMLLSLKSFVYILPLVSTKAFEKIKRELLIGRFETTTAF